MSGPSNLGRALVGMSFVSPHVRWFELKIGAASGFVSRRSAPSLQSRFPKPRFFVRVGAGNHTLFQTKTSGRTLSPQWNESKVVPINPSQPLKFEVFRKSTMGPDECLGFFEITLAQLNSDGNLVNCQTVEESLYDITLGLHCRQPRTSQEMQLRPQSEHFHSSSDTASIAESASELDSVSHTGVVPAPMTAPQTSLNPGNRSRIFALVIGIDNYQSPHRPKLQGAANDARDMYGLLQTTFGVPASRITYLRDLEATRDRIIAGFKSLTENPEIQRGDAVVVFFAGHGSRAPAPPEWNVQGGMVETMCPVDEELGADGSHIHGIPDRSISALVNKLSRTKGGNITLIFDCCHSGGIARGDGPKQLSRSAPPSETPLPVSLDEDLFRAAPQSRGGGRKAGFASALADYVLLAACRSNEEAKESDIDGNPCGAFSKALFPLLRSASHTTTYSDIMRSAVANLKSSQHPICEGEFKNSPLFNGMAVRQDAKLFMINKDESGTYSVDAGAIHGITPNLVFSIREFNPNTGAFKEIGLLEAREVSVGSSVLKPIGSAASFDLTQDSRAAVQGWPTSDHLLAVYFDGVPEPSPPSARGYRVVASMSDSNLVLQPAAGPRISFTRGAPISKHAPAPLVPNFPFTPLALRHTLNMIGDFHYHLTRNNPSVWLSLKGMVSLRIHELKNGTPGEDLFSGGAAHVKPTAEYGITIVNESNLNLYPYIFFFDPTEYSIQKWYCPPSDNAEAPLAAKQKEPTVLSVGFHNCPYGGPFDFSIPQGAESDLGFLKLFVSTCQVDMDSLVQGTAFTAPPAANTEGGRGGGRRAAGRAENTTWDAQCYALNIHD